VIDGGTSVSHVNNVGADCGDVAWFSKTLSLALAAQANLELTPEALHAVAIAEVGAAY